MRKDKEKAFELRRQGQSYGLISKNLGISKSTLAGWFKHEIWSREIRNKLFLENSLLNPARVRLMVTANKKTWDKGHEECRDEAVKEFPGLQDNHLFVSGLMLYWGEGDKVLKNGNLRFTNSEPEMIKIFCLFLTKALNIPTNKIAARLLLYPDLADAPQRKFWSKVINIPLENFRKSVYITGRHPTRRLSYGVCNVDVYSRKLKEKVLKWLELYRQYLINSV